MPNHLHALLYFAGGNQSFNTLIGNGKRFMAYDIVGRLKDSSNYQVLQELQKGVNLKDRSRGKKHQVWKSSFDVKQCRTEKFTLQKLNYIHYNPCHGRSKLAKEPRHYLQALRSFILMVKHRYILCGITGIFNGFKITEVVELLIQ